MTTDHEPAGAPFPWPAFLAATLLPFVVLAPFANKAYTVDDTLSLWIAEQIQSDPLNFFGVDINWYGTADPAYEIIKNPPGLFYLLAGFFALFGWDEIPAHLFMAALTSLTAAGTFLLARRMCARPLLATLIAALSPVVLLAGSTVMTDIPMLACYVWALNFWLRGLDSGREYNFAVSGILIGVGTLMKYFCLSAIPLLAVYTVLRMRRAHASLFYLVIPAFIVGAYVVYGLAAYDVNLLSSAAGYAIEYERDRGGNSPLDRAFVGVIFLGGCCIPALFFAPALWRGRTALLLAAIAAALVVFVLTRGRIADEPLRSDEGIPWNLVVHAAIFCVAGAHVFALALADLIKRRDAQTVLLACWIAGTFVFAAILNWTVNGRTLMPIAIPAAILIARRFDDVRPWTGLRQNLAAGVPLLLTAAVSIAVLWGDARWSNTQRSAARHFAEASRAYGRDYYYKGHWGFQYYMYAYGLPAFDSLAPNVVPGDRIVLPENNYAPGGFNPEVALPVAGAGLLIAPSSGVATMHRDASAGFYTHFWGILPYRFGPVPEERYWVYQIGDYRDVD